MFTSNLGIGPMSTEVIEAVFKYSHYHRKNLMLIASKNQIDHSGGYVNGWNTKQYCGYLNEMKNKYSYSSVQNCRDHCGPGFTGNMSMDDIYKTIKTDIENGFDLIHIDLCYFQGTNEERLNESKKAIEYCLKLNENIAIEIGTDENLGSKYSFNSIKEIGDELKFFKSFFDPEYFVVQTGSLVKEINQVGSFNKDFIEECSNIIHSSGIKLKEHNADYLSTHEIQRRKNIIDAMNIAPQLGVVQTSLVFNKCLIYGVRFDDFIEMVYQSGRWKKWMYKSKKNKQLCAHIAGHYHFASHEYKRIVEELNQHEDFHETIIETIMEVIDHYESSL